MLLNPAPPIRARSHRNPKGSAAPPPAPWRVVGLCAGIGVFEAAAVQVPGLVVVAAYDLDPRAVAWHQAALRATGRPGYPVEVADLTQLERIPPCELVVAGLPCQPFSGEGTQAGMEDPRGAPLWHHTARLAAAAGAQVVLVENVAAATPAVAAAGAAIFAAAGFPAHQQTIRAASEDGSAQQRSRLWATFSRCPLDWTLPPGPGPRPLQAFLLTEDDTDLVAPPDTDPEEEEAQILRAALEPCYLGATHQAGLITIRRRKAGQGNRGLRPVPVTHRGTIAACTASYWKAGGSITVLADRCLECGYGVTAGDDFLYLTDLDQGEATLPAPAHLFCGCCVQELAREGSSQWDPAGETWVAIPPLDLTQPELPDWQRYLQLRLGAGATSCRRFHPRELARFLGLPDTWPLPAAPGVAARLLGNALHLPTARRVIARVVEAARR